MYLSTKIIKSKNITSPGFPSKYPPDIECSWIVICTEGYRVSANIIELVLERGFDQLTLGNGQALYFNVIARLTGTTKLRVLTSVGSEMWIEFRSDGVVNLEGFVVQFTQVTDVAGKLLF